jgi:hypothetical protein
LFTDLARLPDSPLEQWKRGDDHALTDSLRGSLVFHEKSAPFLDDGVAGAPQAIGFRVADWWGKVVVNKKLAPPPAPEPPPVMPPEEVTRFADLRPACFSYNSHAANNPLFSSGHPSAGHLAELRELGLTEQMFEPLNRMQWAASDWFYAFFAAGGLLACAAVLWGLSLARGRAAGRAASALQWVIPAADVWLGAALAVGLTLGSLATVLAMHPEVRLFPLRIEPDIYFYASTAALLLFALFAAAASAIRWRGKALGWGGPLPVLVWLPVLVASGSLVLQIHAQALRQQGDDSLAAPWFGSHPRIGSNALPFRRLIGSGRIPRISALSSCGPWRLIQNPP